MQLSLNNIISAGVNPTIAASWVQKLNMACAKFNINTPLRIAHFLAQTAHESAGLTVTVENLNYSASGLINTFPKYFSTLNDAMPYAHNPEKIANYVYANRMGNFGEETGDGWKYRGRGFIQMTGRNTYKDYGHAINPETIDPADSSGWFWYHMNLNHVADEDNIIVITRMINGGLNGLDDRKHRLAKVKASLGIQLH